MLASPPPCTINAFESAPLHPSRLLMKRRGPPRAHRLDARAAGRGELREATSDQPPERPSKRPRTREGSQTRNLGDPNLSAAEFRGFVARMYLRIDGLEHCHPSPTPSLATHPDRSHQGDPTGPTPSFLLWQNIARNPHEIWGAMFADHRNDMSATKTQQLAERATRAGASGVEAYARVGTSGKWIRNSARDLLRSMLKGTKMLALYWARIPMFDPKTRKNNVLTWMPFLLVHEVLAALWKDFGETLYQPSEHVAKQLRSTCTNVGINAKKETVFPLGVHGDGVPNQAHKSVVCFTWNILAEKNSERILFASLGKDRTWKIICSCMLVDTHQTHPMCTIEASRCTSNVHNRGFSVHMYVHNRGFSVHMFVLVLHVRCACE